MNAWMILAAEAVQEAEGGLFDLDATLPLMAVQILVLVFLLNAVFYKPFGKVLDDRDQFVRGGRQDAKARLAEVKALTAQYEQELAATRKQSQALIAEAQAEASRIAVQQLAEAQREAQAQREQAQQEIDQQKAVALQALDQQVDALSHQILDKLLARA